jgi:hypothetical protein
VPAVADVVDTIMGTSANAPLVAIAAALMPVGVGLRCLPRLMRMLPTVRYGQSDVRCECLGNRGQGTPDAVFGGTPVFPSLTGQPSAGPTCVVGSHAGGTSNRPPVTKVSGCSRLGQHKEIVGRLARSRGADESWSYA